MNSSLLAEIKTTEQDFEWYPTTNEIIDKFFEHVNHYQIDGLLDVGAGDGNDLTPQNTHIYPAFTLLFSLNVTDIL